MTLTALQVKQLNNMNAAAQRAGLGTLLSYGDPAGVVYFVDGNAGDDDNGGLSWGDAFQTLSVALAASHANIAASSAGWAARNRIYFKADQSADAEGEDLVLLAQKTDIIGVGSTSNFTQSTLVGNHVPISATGIGVRFFNIRFKCPAAGGSMFTLNSTQRGIEFHDCTFDATNSASATSAIIATDVWFLKIHNCNFVGPFVDSVINIGTGNAQGLEIVNNYIQGAADGIEIATDTISSPKHMLIENNTLVTGTICVNDISDLAYVNRNNGYTGNAKGTTGFGGFQVNIQRSQDNRLTASNGNNIVVPAEGSI